jgi:enoyl-CoA hydratase
MTDSTSPATTVLKVVRYDDHTASVLLCDPRKGNPMGAAFWEELPRVFDSLDADPRVRAIVLATEQANFTFGLDLVGMGPKLMPAVTGGMAGRAEIEQLGRTMQAAFTSVVRCSKPTVVAVAGWCIGGGVELLAACDVRVCSANAKFSLREVRMGMVPDLGGIQRLPFIIGEGNARLLALTGIDIDAARALSMSLVSEVHATPETAIQAARAIAAAIAANPPRVVGAIKGVMNARMESSVTAGLTSALVRNASLMQSADFQEAIAAFMAKRPPIFNGA